MTVLQWSALGLLYVSLLDRLYGLQKDPPDRVFDAFALGDSGTEQEFPYPSSLNP